MKRLGLWLTFALLCGELAVGEAFGQRKPATPEAASGPQLYTSRNFQLYTDIPQLGAEELLERLETMLKLVSAYYGRPLRKQIRMYVVDELGQWPAEELAKMDPGGLQSIRTGGGLTVTAVRSVAGGGPKLDADAIVYAISGHGTPQHEAVHAYCGITFGEVGPVWYSEGMAEIGKYWKEGDRGVNAGPEVIRYLQSVPRKPLNEIVNNPLERTGDSWQNYSWRWALCHLLSFNENYAARFKPLGMALLNGRNASFDQVYGSQLQEIEFEYALFIQDVEPGYRNDLCSWDWKTRFKPLSGKAQNLVKIDAQKGWQASRVTVKSGTVYSISTEGTWTLDGESLSAAGDDSGRGCLVGVVFDDYSLSESFDLGGTETFTAPVDGQLYLRCRSDWGKITLNKGTVTVRIKLATAE